MRTANDYKNQAWGFRDEAQSYSNSAGGSAGAAAGGAAAAAAAAATAGVSAAAAGGSAAAAEVSATAAAVSAQEAQDATYASARHFVAADLPNSETCNGSFYVKDTFGISTVTSINQSGAISTAGSISVNPSGSSSVFTASTAGDVTCNSLSTSTISSATNLNVTFSQPLTGGSVINIGRNSVGLATNVINIGGMLDQVYINGLPYSPFNINTGSVSQW